MDTITVRFTSRWPWHAGSFMVAHLTGSRMWSHTMCIIGNRAYEACLRHGCRALTVQEAMLGVVRYRDMHVPVANLAAAQAFGEKQCGQPYDWAGAFGLPLLQSEDWSDDSRWWCSEHSFAMLGAGGTWLLDPAESKRVTPNDLHQCNYPKTPIIDLRPGKAPVTTF